jgi:DNA-binding XRE family transcriptional regulator
MSETFFGSNLKFLRKKMAVSQSHIGLQVGRKHTSIGNWENDYNEPNLKEISTLAHFFGVSIDDMLNKNLENETGFTSNTGKTPPNPIKETKLLLIEDDGMLTKMEEEMKQMRAEYDRRLSKLEHIVLNPATLHVDNRLNEPEFKKSKHA